MYIAKCIHTHTHTPPNDHILTRKSSRRGRGWEGGRQEGGGREEGGGWGKGQGGGKGGWWGRGKGGGEGKGGGRGEERGGKGGGRGSPERGRQQEEKREALCYGGEGRGVYYNVKEEMKS